MAGWAFYAIVLAGGAAAIGLLISTVSLVVRSRHQEPSLQLVQRIQSQWNSPIMEDEAFARHIVEVITCPAVKESYRLELIIEDDYGQGDESPGWKDQNAIRIVVDAEFVFRNISARELTLTLDLPDHGKPPGLEFGGKLLELTLDGKSVNLSAEPASRKNLPIRLSSGSHCRIRSKSVRLGRTPYVAIFPQSLTVRSGATIRIISRVHDPVRVLVGDGEQYSLQSDDSEAWAAQPLEIKRPLLQGEAILLSVGV
jgi:hypothetical protein